MRSFLLFKLMLLIRLGNNHPDYSVTRLQGNYAGGGDIKHKLYEVTRYIIGYIPETITTSTQKNKKNRSRHQIPWHAYMNRLIPQNNVLILTPCGGNLGENACKIIKSGGYFYLEPDSCWFFDLNPACLFDVDVLRTGVPSLTYPHMFADRRIKLSS